MAGTNSEPATEQRELDLRRQSLIAAPVVLLVTTYLAFRALMALLGVGVGFFAGMVFYWVIWCLAFPLWAVGAGELREAFRNVPPRFGPRPWVGWVLLAIPVAMAVSAGAMESWGEATPLIVLASIPFALVNGTLEELLWRGTYVRAFPDHRVLGFLYPAFGFAIWHLAPVLNLSHYYTPEWMAAGIAASLILGLCWGWVAWRTGSIRWVAISHILVNLGLLSPIVFLG